MKKILIFMPYIALIVSVATFCYIYFQHRPQLEVYYEAGFITNYYQGSDTLKMIVTKDSIFVLKLIPNGFADTIKIAKDFDAYGSQGMFVNSNNSWNPYITKKFKYIP